MDELSWAWINLARFFIFDIFSSFSHLFPKLINTSLQAQDPINVLWVWFWMLWNFDFSPLFCCRSSYSNQLCPDPVFASLYCCYCYCSTVSLLSITRLLPAFQLDLWRNEDGYKAVMCGWIWSCVCASDHARWNHKRGEISLYSFWIHLQSWFVVILGGLM